MIAYLKVTSVIASLLILAGCAAGGGTVAAGHHPACPAQTGSRIAADGTDCSIIGRSYTGEDVSRTGATSAAEALRLMDPSITVNR